MTTTAKGRDHSMDLLKGIAIYLVVMGHALTMCIRDIDAAFIFKLIGQVHMPIFFFISGYFSYKRSESREFAAPRLKKRFLQLMVPFFAVSALWVCYFPHSGLQSPLHSNIIGLYRTYWKDGYWFPLCLFELALVYYALSYLFSKVRSTVWQVVVLVAVYGILAFLASRFSSVDENIDWAGAGLLAKFFPIFMAGVFARKFQERWDKFRTRQAVLAVSMVLFAVLLYVIVYPWDMPWGDNALATKGIKTVALPLMQVALMIVALAAVRPWSDREFAPGRTPGAVARYFSLLGNESLGIYLLHYFFLFPLTALQQPLRDMALGFTPLAVVSAAVAFCVIAVTLLLVKILSRSKWLAIAIIGKV